MVAIASVYVLVATFQNVETRKYSHPKELRAFNSAEECQAAKPRLLKEYIASVSYGGWHYRVYSADCEQMNAESTNAPREGQ